MTRICVGKLTIIGSDNGLSPGRRQAIIWTNAGILLIRPLGTNFNEILIEIQTFSFKKMYLKMSSAKWRPFCLGLNVLRGPSLFTSVGASFLSGNFSSVARRICFSFLSLITSTMQALPSNSYKWQAENVRKNACEQLITTHIILTTTFPQ